MLTDPSYNRMGVQYDESSNHEYFFFADMKVLSMLVRMLQPRGHGHIFCRTLQFRPVYSVRFKEVLVQDWTSRSGSDFELEK